MIRSGLLFLIPMAITLISCSSQKKAPVSDRIRVLLDTDANNELDDQHALAYMLFNGNVFDVEGITVNRTRNGGDINQQAEEAERVVKLCALHPQMKVYKGADGSFEEIADHVDKAGFDGAEAVDFIIDRAGADDARPLVLLPVGKLTNIALALKKAPSVFDNVRIVWLGSNYPDPGEYNQVNDEPALNFVLDSGAAFEIALVRGGKSSGTAAVRATPEEIKQRMPGRGPRLTEPVTGRHGGEFYTFGDYSVDLFGHARMHGDPPSRALFDMAAVAIVKNPAWAQSRTIPAPEVVDGKWIDRPDNPRKIVLWENFSRDEIMEDFYRTMEDYRLAE